MRILVLLLAIAGAALFALKPWEGDPVVVLMDTTAKDGVYGKENRENGGNNAQDLSKVLQELKPYIFLPEPVSSSWNRQSQIVKLHPRLVIMHRSMLFHALNAEFKFGSPRSPNEGYDPERWKLLYEVADERLASVMGFVGTVDSRTQFLIYSRGTDTNWLNQTWRSDWVKGIEDQYPKLRGRIHTMEIQGDYETATFTNPEIGRLIRDEVRKILRLPDKRN